MTTTVQKSRWRLAVRSRRHGVNEAGGYFACTDGHGVSLDSACSDSVAHAPGSSFDASASVPCCWGASDQSFESPAFWDASVSVPCRWRGLGDQFRRIGDAYWIGRHCMYCAMGES